MKRSYAMRVEHVAKALWGRVAANHQVPQWDAAAPDIRDHYRQMARVALNADADATSPVGDQRELV